MSLLNRVKEIVSTLSDSATWLGSNRKPHSAETKSTQVETVLLQSTQPHEPEPAGWFKRYRVVRELGTGGMGKVLLAERVIDGTLVCLKFLHVDMEIKGRRRMVEQECRALLRLRHPSIVGLIDFSLDEQTPWLATEYAPGQTLQHYMKEHSPMTPKAVRQILKTLLEALDYAHAHQVIHRDFKPANVIIDPQKGFNVRILDFGISIVDGFDYEDNPTACGGDRLMGTLVYMAPEQFRGDLLTPACDLYSIGLMAWEMLTGCPAFEDCNPARLLHQKMTTSSGRRVEDSAVPVPSVLNEFIEACTRADPNTRPTAREGLTILGPDT